MKIEKPGEVMFTLERTMKLSDWIKLSEQLRDGAGYVASWPALDFINDIRDMTAKARVEFLPND